MADYTESAAKRLAQLLREAETAYTAYRTQERTPRDRHEWSAAHLLASGKLAKLFLDPSEQSFREESTEVG